MTDVRPEATFIHNGVLAANYFEDGLEIDLSSEDMELDQPTILFVGTGGTIKVDLSTSGTGITFGNVPSGTTLPIKVSKVYKIGTDAEDIIGLY